MIIDNAWTPEGWAWNMTNWLLKEELIKKKDIDTVETSLKLGASNLLHRNKCDQHVRDIKAKVKNKLVYDSTKKCVANVVEYYDSYIDQATPKEE